MGQTACFGDNPAFGTTLFDMAASECRSATGVGEAGLSALSNAIASCRLGSGPDTCGTGPVSSAVGSAVFSGTTTGKGHHRYARCVRTSETPDVTHSWTPPETGRYTIDVEGSEFLVALGLEESCVEETVSSRCANPPVTPQPSFVNYTLTAGTIYYIVVDGIGATEHGQYVVNITRLD